MFAISRKSTFLNYNQIQFFEMLNVLVNRNHIDRYDLLKDIQPKGAFRDDISYTRWDLYYQEAVGSESVGTLNQSEIKELEMRR